MDRAQRQEYALTYFSLPRLTGYDNLGVWASSLRCWLDVLELGWALDFKFKPLRAIAEDRDDQDILLDYTIARTALLWTIDQILPRMQAFVVMGMPAMLKRSINWIFHLAAQTAMLVDEAKAASLYAQFACLDSKDFANLRDFVKTADFLTFVLSRNNIPVAVPIYCRVVTEGLATLFPELREPMKVVLRHGQLGTAGVASVIRILVSESLEDPLTRRVKVDEAIGYLSRRLNEILCGHCRVAHPRDSWFCEHCSACHPREMVECPLRKIDEASDMEDIDLDDDDDESDSDDGDGDGDGDDEVPSLERWP